MAFGFLDIVRRAVEAVESDPAAARRAVYENLRRALSTQLSVAAPPIPSEERVRQRKALDEAILLVEREASDRGAPSRQRTRPHARERNHYSPPDVAPATDATPSASEVGPQREEADAGPCGDDPQQTEPERPSAVPPHVAEPSPLPVQPAERADRASDRLDRKITGRALFAMAGTTLIVVLAIGTVYALILARAGKLPTFGVEPSANRAKVPPVGRHAPSAWSRDDRKDIQQRAATPPPSADPTEVAPQIDALLPRSTLPPSHGVFAAIGGTLVELAAVPQDTRSRVTGADVVIKEASRGHLPSGHVSFIVSRPESAERHISNANVTIVARVARQRTVDKAGQNSIVAVDNTWVVRPTGYSFGRQVVADASGVSVYWPTDPSLVLPPGRYVLDLGDASFDFSVDGPVRDPRHCVDHVISPTGATYRDCPEQKEFLARAEEWLKRRAFQRAIDEYSEAIRVAPDQGAAFIGRGKVWLARNDLARAMADFDRGIALSPESAAAFEARGVAHDMRRDLEHAAADYTKSLALDPKWQSGRVFVTLGAVWLARDDVPRAIATYDDFIKHFPATGRAHLLRGRALERVGRFDQAIADYGDAIRLESLSLLSAGETKISPSAPPATKQDALRARGRLYERNGDLERAASDYADAIASHPVFRRVDDYVALARIQMSRNDHHTAGKTLADAIAFAPNAFEPYRLRAELMKAAKRRDDAIIDYRRALALLPAGGPETAALGSEIAAALKALKAPLKAQLSEADVDAVNAKIKRCWTPAPNTEIAVDTRLQIMLTLNRDGTLSGDPNVLTPLAGPMANAVTEAAVKAVTICQPYRLPTSEYEAWREIVVTVGP